MLKRIEKFTMDSSSPTKKNSYQTVYLNRYQIVIILFVFQFISCCNAYFYSEKKSTLGDDEKDCFCEVI